ncbi:hypothetical protein ACL8F4_00005, partial [Escherichia coli]
SHRALSEHKTLSISWSHYLRTGEFFEMLITEKYLEHKRRK